jgi:hypothetical protein
MGHNIIMNAPLSRLAALALILAAASASRADDFAGAEAPQLVETLRSENAKFCSAAGEMRAFSGVPCSTFGDFNQKDLIAAAKAVFGEASNDPDEQCAIALTIFNRARDERRHPASLVASPGQFEGYSSADRRECVKLKGAVAAVATMATVGRCKFGPRAFKYFCSVEGWNRVKKKRKPGSEQAEIIGETAFLTKGPC